MNPTLFCIKLQKPGEALSAPPFPGELGQQIYTQVSKQAWTQWLNHQTMLINEYRLTLIDPKAREFLRSELKKYFFEGGATPPQGFVPEKIPEN